MYQVIIKKEALKELKLLPKQTVVAISVSIEQLSENPRPVGCKKLKGSNENLWRIRIGDYRVIYLIEDVIRIVNVRHIGHRKNIYD
jgi:mRNA interferase RelE/StbE